MYSMKDLEEAREALATWRRRAENDSSNNPNKYQADITEAFIRVNEIEEHLKKTGEIPMSDIELLRAELDAKYPDAKSKDVVEHDGRRFQRRFFPLAKSASGKTVLLWGKTWDAL